MSAPATAAIDAALARWLDNEPDAYVPIRDDILADLDAAGYVVVPREMTETIYEAGRRAQEDGDLYDIWRDQLAAAEAEAKEDAP